MRELDKLEKEVYEQIIGKTDVSNQSLIFYLFGSSEEHGETLGILKRIYRGDFGEEIKSQLTEVEDRLTRIILENPAIRLEILKEKGDQYWYDTRFLQKLQSSWSEVEQINIEKITKRHATGKILGKGGDREIG